MQEKLLCMFRNSRVLLTGIIWLLVFFFWTVLLPDLHLNGWMHTMMTLVPVLPFGFFMIAYISHVRKADEFARRIQLEALVFAFPFTLVLLFSLTLLENAHLLSGDAWWDFGNVWIVAFVFYFIGLSLARRRYK